MKDNQKTLHDDVHLLLDDPARHDLATARTVDADYGRIETRTATISTDIGLLQEHHRWPGHAAIGKVERIRETADKTSRETEYYLLSAAPASDRFLEVVRSHWAIEDRLHWRLDVVMNEDQQRARADNGPHNPRGVVAYGVHRHAEAPIERPVARQTQAGVLGRGRSSNAAYTVLTFEVQLT